tara:strand:+ start:1484 stop:3436 length:1953 start_codon:yes stop_codon:yes gene_type:complete
MKLSIVVVNYNVKHFLEQCLTSVEKALFRLDAEVIVVDNNSVDNSLEMLAHKFPWVQIISNKVNTGFSVANNQAIRIAKGEYVLLLNPDTLVEEDTLEKCVEFMDTHPSSGGLGVKMVDGKGEFLPESKRSLPKPIVAFYKIFGLASLFPRSKIFGAYHLGHLSKDETHEVEILSGAFMMLKKETLNLVGLLDENFFMYGEDIDLSYRITLSGYKNYYFSGTRIIHYKGESTKKGSLNYVFIFYKAMILFAKKHFSNKKAWIFTLLINFAIYFRATLSILKRFFSYIWLPSLDFLLVFTFMVKMTNFWEINHRFVEGGSYPDLFMQIFIPSYIVLWLGINKLSGVYDQPFKISKLVLGTILGTVLILSVYALLPEVYRFSRALILIGSFGTGILLVLLRLVLSSMEFFHFSFEHDSRKRLLIIGTPEECLRVSDMLKEIHFSSSFIGFIYPETSSKSIDNFVGTVDQLHEAVQIYSIDELIFCSKDISAQDIISHMSLINKHKIDFKIAPEESMYVIGSNSINSLGELYAYELNSINKPENIRLKRLFDIFISLIFILTSPVLIFLSKSMFGLFKNIFLVLFGLKSWVSYNNSNGNKGLPKIKPGVLSPASHLPGVYSNLSLAKQNMLYAKEYRLKTDFEIILKNLKRLA